MMKISPQDVAISARRHRRAAAPSACRKADYGGVEIGIFVDLCAAEEADFDAAALQPITNISGTDTVVSAVSHNSPSPIESGRIVGLVASVPDS